MCLAYIFYSTAPKALPNAREQHLHCSDPLTRHVGVTLCTPSDATACPPPPPGGEGGGQRGCVETDFLTLAALASYTLKAQQGYCEPLVAVPRSGMLTSTPRVRRMLSLKAGIVKDPKY